jgi:DNA-binding MarR family transcriptional regulator
MTDRAHEDLSERDYRRLAAFRHALRLFLRFSEQAARAEGITTTQHQLLLAVRGWPHPDAPTISELAQQLQLKVHSTSELARRAETAGLVDIENDPDDHRRQRVTLTDVGLAKLRSLSVQHRDELRRFRLHLADLLDMLEDDPTRPLRP